MSSFQSVPYQLQKLEVKETIFIFFQSHCPSLHIYEIGDLDDFFFPYTTWYALTSTPESSSDEIKFIVLLYQSPDCTVVLAFATEDAARNGDEVKYGQEALSLLRPSLPDSFYSQLTPGLLGSLTSTGIDSESYYHVEPHGDFLKMAIPDSARDQVREKMTITQQNSSIKASRLESKDLEIILAFYREAYPGNWFDPRMLETGQYYGIWDPATIGDESIGEEERKLCAIAGIHVYSPSRRVAALGNITTHPNYRKRGYAKIVTTALVLSLYDAGVERVGLNVKGDNVAAITLYESLGFIKIGRYEENMLFKR